jgi:hypothetical protein
VNKKIIFILITLIAFGTLLYYTQKKKAGVAKIAGITVNSHVAKAVRDAGKATATAPVNSSMTSVEYALHSTHIKEMLDREHPVTDEHQTQAVKRIRII